MVQRFLFDRINRKAAGAAVTGHHNPVVQILSDEAQAALAFVQFAKSGAKIALHPAIGQNMPIIGCYGILANKFGHYHSPGSANKVRLVSVTPAF